MSVHSPLSLISDPKACRKTFWYFKHPFFSGCGTFLLPFCFREGPIFKRSGGHRIQGLNCIGHHQFCFRWSRRWLVVKDSFLMYMNRDNGHINFVLLFDKEFKVKVGRAYTDTRYGVCFENFTRYLIWSHPRQLQQNLHLPTTWWLGLFFSFPGAWSSNAAATDKLIGGVMKSISWRKPVTFSKNIALKGLLLHGRTCSLNGQDLPDVTIFGSSGAVLMH